MSLAELSRKSEVSRQTIYSYIKDEAINPSIEILDKLAGALLVSPQEIYYAAGLIPDKPDEDEELKEILHLYRQLSPEDQERITEISRTLLTMNKLKHKTMGE